MIDLTEQALFQAIRYAKSIDENSGRQMITRFQLNQTPFAQTLFEIFPSVIAEQNQAMAQLFMDLCFDVMAVFEHAFGEMPDQRIIGNHWLDQYAALLERELANFMPGKIQNDTKSVSGLSEALETEAQTGLVQFLYASIDDYATEYPINASAVRMTKMMIFAVVQLFNSLYDEAAKHQRRVVH